MKIRIAFLAFGHVDVTLPLINALREKKSNCDLIFCFAQNRKVESVFDFSNANLPDGLLDKEWNEKLINKNLPSSNYSYKWDGTNLFGNKVNSGMYVYNLQIGEMQESGKMILMDKD